MWDSYLTRGANTRSLFLCEKKESSKKKRPRVHQTLTNGALALAGAALPIPGLAFVTEISHLVTYL